MLTGLFLGLCNGFFDFLDLIFDDPCLPFRRKRDFLKLRVADNDGIVVAGCDAGAKTLSIGGFKVFLAGNEQLCIGVSPSSSFNACQRQLIRLGQQCFSSNMIWSILSSISSE